MGLIDVLQAMMPAPGMDAAPHLFSVSRAFRLIAANRPASILMRAGIERPKTAFEYRFLRRARRCGPIWRPERGLRKAKNWNYLEFLPAKTAQYSVTAKNKMPRCSELLRRGICCDSQVTADFISYAHCLGISSLTWPRAPPAVFFLDPEFYN
ncbi:MAG: hypothetical protein AAFY22_07105 [Pseudomonadota bacterium]